MNIPRLKNGNSSDATARRLKARYYVLIKGDSQKEAGIRVGVSEKSICVWAKAGKWNDKKFNGIKKVGGIETIMQDFFIVVLSKDPRLYKKVTELWNGYLQQVKDEFKEDETSK